MNQIVFALVVAGSQNKNCKRWVMNFVYIHISDYGKCQNLSFFIVYSLIQPLVARRGFAHKTHNGIFIVYKEVV